MTDGSEIEWASSPEQLGHGVRIFERLIESVNGALLIFIMVLTCVDVVGRYVFLSPVPGAAELIALSMGVLIFAALPIVSARGMHVSIALIDNIVPPSLRRPHYLLVQLFSVAVLALLSWRIFEVADYLESANEATVFLGIPKAPFAYILAVFAVLSAIFNGLVAALSLRRSYQHSR